jgi:hypothetical protein
VDVRPGLLVDDSTASNFFLGCEEMNEQIHNELPHIIVLLLKTLQDALQVVLIEVLNVKELLDRLYEFQVLLISSHLLLYNSSTCNDQLL